MKEISDVLEKYYKSQEGRTKDWLTHKFALLGIGFSVFILMFEKYTFAKGVIFFPYVLLFLSFILLCFSIYWEYKNYKNVPKITLAIQLIDTYESKNPNISLQSGDSSDEWGNYNEKTTELERLQTDFEHYEKRGSFLFVISIVFFIIGMALFINLGQNKVDLQDERIIKSLYMIELSIEQLEKKQLSKKDTIIIQFDKFVYQFNNNRKRVGQK